MIYPVQTNIMPLFRHLVEAIRPFAEINSIDLQFESGIEALEITHYPERVISDLTVLMCRVITFTPQDRTVRIGISIEEKQEGQSLLFRIESQGADLKYLEGLIPEIRTPVSVKFQQEFGTSFEIKYPVSPDESVEEPDHLPKEEEYAVPVFYRKFREHLQSYYTSIRNLEEAASARSRRDGIFLQKANAVILANLDREDFDVVALSRALALSRSQFYRRLKDLIQLSPAQYLRFVRLQKAKEFLENTDLSVGEIAFQVGFFDKSHFTRVFKRQFGFSPSHFRHKN